MNGRAARNRHQGERQRIEAVLDRAARNPALLVKVIGNQEIWRRGDVAFVLPRLADDYPAPLKDAISARRRAALDGVCVCGGRRKVVSATSIEFDHTTSCDATDDRILAIGNEVGIPFRRWIA
ncbi:MAG TPA: hypothetical protein VGL75_10655 [Acidothermaceae bacterium]|jgi:hypothetical protein